MERLRGITVEDHSGLFRVRQSIRALGVRPLARFVPNVYDLPRRHDLPVRQLHASSDVMYQIANGKDIGRYKPGWFQNTVLEAIRILRGYVKIWECGHEINCSAAGEDPSFKTSFAIDRCREAGELSAVTLRWENSQSFFQFIDQNTMRPDFLFVSIEPSSDVVLPEWQPFFEELGNRFPGSRLGIGEFGFSSKASLQAKTSLVHKFYRLPVTHDRYVGGGFYRHFVRDCVKRSDGGILDAIREAWI